MQTNPPSSTDSEEMPTNEDGVNLITSDSSNFVSTPQTSNGQNKSRTARDKIDKFTDDLELYCKVKGVPESMPRHIDHYINMPRSELSSHTTNQLYEIQFEVQSYLYHLQTVHNQQVAKADRCQYEIDRIITPLMDSYKDIYGREEKRNAAIFGNEHARSFRDFEVRSRAAAKRTENLVQRLENISRILDKIAWRRHDGEK